MLEKNLNLLIGLSVIVLRVLTRKMFLVLLHRFSSFSEEKLSMVRPTLL